MKTTIFALTLALVPSAWATSISYSFTNPTGKLGTSQTYTNDGVTITAYGYDNGKATDLFGNVNGIGLVVDGNQVGDNDGFIQLDLKNFWAVNPTGATITIGDVQKGESWEVFGSNTLGSLGTEIETGTNNAPVSTALALTASTYRYISVTAAMCSDVVLSGLGGTIVTTNNVSPTPEPGSFAMIGIGASLLGLAAFKRKR
jgi:hypothetical protein